MPLDCEVFEPEATALINTVHARCLILACGNTLRSDDGVGPNLAAWAEERFQGEINVRVLARQQWTPDLAEEIAAAESVLFIDCSIDSAPGSVRLVPVALHAGHSDIQMTDKGVKPLKGEIKLFGGRQLVRSFHSLDLGDISTV